MSVTTEEQTVYNEILAPRRFEWVVWYHDGPVMAVRWG